MKDAGSAAAEKTREPLLAKFSKPVFFISGIGLGIHLFTASRYGYHRDELYFLAAAERPDWGYVDFPPLTPMLAWLSETLFPSSLVALRSVPALAGAAIVILAALTAREFGAGRFGQNLAATAIVGAPVILGTTGLLSTAAFDILWWTLITYLIARLLRTQEARLWLAIGAVAGVALQTKYTVIVLFAALAIGLLFTSERRWVSVRWLWIGALLALLFWIPNLLWQSDAGWPTFEYLQNQDTSATADSRVSFLLEQTVNPGPLAFLFLVAGTVFLLRHSHTRVLGITVVAAFAIFLATEGKSYYTAGVYPLMAAGAGVATERWLASRRDSQAQRMTVLSALAVFALIPLPGAVPVLPSEGVKRFDFLLEIRPDFADMFGWPELASEVDAVVASLPDAERERAAVVTSNYGQAGAVDFYSSADAYSGHNAYHLWGSPDPDTEVLVAVGFDRGRLDAWCGRLELAGTLTNDEGVKNFEYGKPIFICRDLRIGVEQLWEEVKRYTA